MADKKISELNVASAVYDTDDFALVQAADTKQVNASIVKAYIGDAPTIVGGTINATPVGVGTQAAGSFTTLNSSSTTTLNGTTIPASKTLLVTTDIGSSVQAYDADLTAWAGKTAPSGDAVGTSDSQTLTNKTISGSSNTLSNIANASLINSSITFGSTATSLGGTVSALNGVSVGATTASSGAFTTLSASSTVSGTGFSTYLASPPAIGGTTPAAGNFTTLGATGNVTLGDASGDTLTINAGTTTFAQGTANGVLYLNGSKVATSGTGLVFDGSNFVVGNSSISTGRAAIWGDGNGAASGATNANSQLHIVTTNPAVNANNAARITFNAGNGNGVAAKIEAVRDGNDTFQIINGYSGPIVFGTNSTNIARITSKGLLVGYTDDGSLSSVGNAIFSGNVGIGTASPGYKLDINGGSNAYSFRLLTTTTNALQVFADSATTGLGPYIGSSGNNLLFGRAGVAEYMRLDSSGNLGLGVTPGTIAKLDIKSDSTAITGTQIRSSSVGTGDGSTTAKVFRTVNSGAGDWANAQYDAWSHVWTKAGSIQTMALDASGNLLVGNTAAAYGARGLFYTSTAYNANTYNPLELGSSTGATVNHQLQKTTVSTTATVILSTGLYASLVVVFGSDGTNRFIDLVLFGLGNGAVGVVSSFTASGTPAARTYSQSSSTYRLAMASGSYAVQAYAMSMNG